MLVSACFQSKTASCVFDPAEARITCALSIHLQAPPCWAPEGALSGGGRRSAGGHMDQGRGLRHHHPLSYAGAASQVYAYVSAGISMEASLCMRNSALLMQCTLHILLICMTLQRLPTLGRPRHDSVEFLQCLHISCVVKRSKENSTKISRAAKEAYKQCIKANDMLFMDTCGTASSSEC